MKYKVKPLYWKFENGTWGTFVKGRRARIVEGKGQAIIYIGDTKMHGPDVKSAAEHVQRIHDSSMDEWMKDGEILPLKWEGRKAKGVHGHYEIKGRNLFYWGTHHCYNSTQRGLKNAAWAHHVKALSHWLDEVCE